VAPGADDGERAGAADFAAGGRRASDPAGAARAVKAPNGNATVCATLTEALRTQADERGGRAAFAFMPDGERVADEWTYAELDRRAKAVAARLAQHRNPVGERALLVLPTGLDFLAAFAGCAYAGAIPVPLSPPRPGRMADRIESVVEDSRPAFCIATASMAEGLRGTPGLDGVERIDIETVSPALSDAWTPRDARPENVAFLQYTSGSLATPKGVVVTHANLMANLRMVKSILDLDADTPTASWLPLFHDLGLISFALEPLCIGARGALMPAEAFLMRPLRWLKLVANFRAHTSGAPNFAWELVMRKLKPGDLDGLDLSCWKNCLSGAEPVRAETLERFAKALAPAGVSLADARPCYGLAEATLGVTGFMERRGPLIVDFDAESLERSEVRAVANDSAGKTRRLVGCGKTPPGCDVRIVDIETGAPCAGDRVGEVLVAGPHVAAGYWNRPEETAAAFFEEGGRRWLRTGDLGFVHEGQLFVAGRLKDLVIVGGKNHYPADIEKSAEAAFAGVRPGGCAAFAVDGPEGEQLAVAAEIERTALREADPAQIVAAIRRAASVEHDLRAEHVVLLRPGDLPRTTSGKLRRREARRLFLAGELKDRTQ